MGRQVARLLLASELFSKIALRLLFTNVKVKYLMKKFSSSVILKVVLHFEKD